METNLKEELNVVQEIQKEKDIISNLNNITEKILAVVRGNLCEECETLQSENCLMDTLKNNNRELARLERNINELAKKVIG